MTTGTTNTGNDTDDAAYWLLEEHVDEPLSSSSSPPPPSCICYGTGRFLRSVLIPILNESFSTNVVCIQPRGTSFVSYMNDSSRTRSTTTGTTSTTSTTRSVGTYEVDVVQPNGSIMTEYIGCRGVFTMNSIMHHLWPLYDTATAVDDTHSTTTSTTTVSRVTQLFVVLVMARTYVPGRVTFGEG